MEDHTYEDPSDFMTPLKVAATQVRELYLAYIDVGFTEEHAIRLVEASITAQGSAQR